MTELDELAESIAAHYGITEPLTTAEAFEVARRALGVLAGAAVIDGTAVALYRLMEEYPNV